ncbi:VWA domain-containing protein [Treponema sp.]|uniref:VWA domain-containing protein n=1 Tax=Treponema sp. TaxID=166 RepID=UPI00388DA1CA
MPFLIERSKYLFLILLLIPSIIFIYLRCKKILRSLKNSFSPKENKSFFRELKFALFSRTLFRSLAWIFAVFALSEISFGTQKIPVHKTGSNITFVFDISYSMLANDCPQNLSRLEATKIYSSELLNKLNSSSFSAVLAKGDGFTVIPETEDSLLMQNLIENLSPNLITSKGSSLGKGIETAINSIPENSLKNQYIWLFTDGEETDGRFEKSLEMAANSGIPVTIIGFGSEKETEILTGDGKDRVKTALRSKNLKNIIENINTRNYAKINSNLKSQIRFIDSLEKGSAWKLLNEVKSISTESENTLSYEIKTVNRHSLLIFTAIMFLILSFVTSQLNISRIKKFRKVLSASLILTSIFLTSSCSSQKKQILEGTWSWYEAKYTQSTSKFLNSVNQVKNDSIEHDYAVFNLGTTYLSMNELDSSFDRLNQINIDGKNIDAKLKSAAFYNMGIICEQKNDYSKASEFFKKSVLADSKNLNARINLELCERELMQKQSKAGESQMTNVNEEKQNNSSLKNELFNLIHENEDRKWRNMQQQGAGNEETLDY